MADIKNADTLIRGDRINIRAAVDAALGETGKHFFLDNIDVDSDRITDAVVEGLESAHGGSTVYTSEGVFTVPDHFPVRINAYGTGF